MKLLVVTAYVTKCGFGADNQHYHTQKPRCDSTEMYPSISKCFIHATVECNKIEKPNIFLKCWVFFLKGVKRVIHFRDTC